MVDNRVQQLNQEIQATDKRLRQLFDAGQRQAARREAARLRSLKIARDRILLFQREGQFEKFKNFQGGVAGDVAFKSVSEIKQQAQRTAERTEKKRAQNKILNKQRTEILKQIREDAISFKKVAGQASKIKRDKKITASVDTVLVNTNKSTSDSLVKRILSAKTSNINTQKELQERQKELNAARIEFIKTAPKNVATGLFEVGKEIVGFVGGSIKGSFNYGRNLRRRFDKGENNPLKNDVVKIVSGTVSVGKFVKDNPLAAAAIVGAASKDLGGQLKTSFVKNPVKTTTKAAAYLFPGTIIKGGVKTVGLGVKGVKSGVQAKRLVGLAKTVKPAKVGATAKQAATIDKAIVKASKIGSKTAREAGIKRTIKSILKQRGITPRKGATLSELAKQAGASSKIAPVKVLPKIPKKQPLRPIKFVDIAKGKTTKITATSPKIKSKPTKIQPKRPIKFVDITKGKTTKISPQSPKLKPIKPKKPIGRPTKEIRVIDIDKGKIRTIKGSKNIQKFKAKQKISKAKQAEVIDINLLLKSKKRGSRLLKNKKAQLRFRQVIEKRAIKLNKATKTLRKAKKIKASNLIKLKKELGLLKSLINVANANRIGRLALIIKLFKDTQKRISEIENKIVPDKKQKTPQKTPAKDRKKIPAKEKAPAKDQDRTPIIIPKFKKKTSLKKKTPQKPKEVIKPKFFRPKKTQPKKEKTKIKIKLRLKLNNLPRSGSRQGYLIRIKEGTRIVAQTIQALPLNRATNVMRTYLDNKPQASGDLVPKGKTSIVDVKKKVLGKKFRVKRSKGTKVLRNVEKSKYRLDKSGEKSISKLKKKKRSSKIKKKRSKTIRKSKKSSK